MKNIGKIRKGLKGLMIGLMLSSVVVTSGSANNTATNTNEVMSENCVKYGRYLLEANKTLTSVLTNLQRSEVSVRKAYDSVLTMSDDLSNLNVYNFCDVNNKKDLEIITADSKFRLVFNNTKQSLQKSLNKRSY